MNENNRNDVTPTPKPPGWIYAYGFTNMSEAPPPPPPAPAPVIATSRFQAERFVLPHPKDAAPLFPILGRSTDKEFTPRIGYSIVPIPSENVALFDEEKMEEVEDRNDTDNGSSTTTTTTRALLGKRKEVGAMVASNTKPCDIQLQTLEPSSSESSATPILPLLPCGDHLPSSNHRYHEAKSKPFLKQRKAKRFDELIDETVKAA